MRTILISSIKRLKIPCFDYVTRHKSFCKTIVHGIVECGQKRGRHRKTNQTNQRIDGHKSASHHQHIILEMLACFFFISVLPPIEFIKFLMVMFTIFSRTFLQFPFFVYYQHCHICISDLIKIDAVINQ